MHAHPLLFRIALPGLVALGAAVVGAHAADARFITDRPAAPIYHEGWIDLNKNGVKDPYEDPAIETEARITDLLGRMNTDEKTAQMVTLYGFPRVVKDELPTPAWKLLTKKCSTANRNSLRTRTS